MFKGFSGIVAVLREETQSFTVGLLDDLVAQAMQDFPNLQRANIRIVTSSGMSRYAQSLGIEFEIPNGALIPPDYQDTSETSVAH